MRTDTAAFGREMDALIAQMRRVAAPLPAAVAMAAQNKALEYLDRQVYDTFPGEVYRRTGNLKKSIRVFLTRLGGGAVRMTLASSAAYAAQVEQGNQLSYFSQQHALTTGGNMHVPAISLAQLDILGQQIADGNPAADVEFGRSGLDYQLPGPFLTPAAAYGTLLFKQVLTASWGQVLAKDAAASKARIKP